MKFGPYTLSGDGDHGLMILIDVVPKKEEGEVTQKVLYYYGSLLPAVLKIKELLNKRALRAHRSADALIEQCEADTKSIIAALEATG